MIFSVIDCGPAPQRANSTLTATTGTQIYSQSRYTCNTGYHVPVIEGMVVLMAYNSHCGDDGMWHPLAMCESRYLFMKSK